MSNSRMTNADIFQWGIISLLLLVSIGANTYFSEQALSIRLAAWLIVGLVSVAIALRTSHGRLIMTFIREAKLELRKVIWPSRQQTIQTTLIVMLMVGITSIVLWGIDTLLMWIISWVTGQRG